MPDRVPTRRILPVLGLIVAGIAIVYAAGLPPNYGCDESPPLGSEQEEAVTTFRAIVFSLTGLIAIVVGVMASRWSRERRIRRGDAGRPGVPTLLCASLPVILLGLVLLAPDDSNAAGSVVLIYMFYGAIAGFFAVPALILAGVVIALTGERRQTSARARARLEAATIAIADALIVLGLPLAVTLAYLQGTGGLCLS